MSIRLTHPEWLLTGILVLPWCVWLALRTHTQLAPWRRWASGVLRFIVLTCVILALAGLQQLLPIEGLNVIYVLDRSDSVPVPQQEAARNFVNSSGAFRKPGDRGGVVIMGSTASIEASPNPIIDLQKIHSVISTERTDIASALRLASAAFPDQGQKRLALLSDGNENLGDALAAAASAAALGISIDVLPLGARRAMDASIQKVSMPATVKKGQKFEVKIFAQSDVGQGATLRLFRDDRLIGEQPVQLEAGKNLFSFPQSHSQPGFHTYDVQLDVPGDALPQNNRAFSFTSVAGDPRVLIVSSHPEQDGPLASVLRGSNLETRLVPITGMPSTLAEIQSYDAIFLSNVAAGDLGRDLMRLLDSAVREFGVGVVCIGGDQTFAAGGYRNTPLETLLPVDMELSSKKVMPNGALAIVVHATEFPGGNQWARDIAFAALDALGPADEMGIVLWDGSDRWLYELSKVGDKRRMGRQISGMNPGDMPNFQHVMEMAYDGLKKSKASIRHLVVFSDGDPGPPSGELLNAIVKDRITISTVMIGGHVLPEPMVRIAEIGKGQFHDVRSPERLPQIFMKEASVILKSAIYEEPFQPRVATITEPVRGFAPGAFPLLRGYVATHAKPRAEVPLLTDKGDPLLAHWQYGLGRTVAFTSDARARWATDWVGWDRYRQFWTQVAQWTLRKVETSELNADVTIEQGEGVLTAEAMDANGQFRNFLNLQAVVVSPKGERKTVRLEQTGPGHYQAHFPTRDTGAYLINLVDIQNGAVRARQTLGASVNYSPEFATAGPNLPLLNRLAELSGGKVLTLDAPQDSPFTHDRKKTRQPRDLWILLLELSILLFPLDVAIRRLQIDREEWIRATRNLRRLLPFTQSGAAELPADESLAALLARKNAVRAATTASLRDTGGPTPAPPSSFPTANPAQPSGPAQPDRPTPPAESLSGRSLPNDAPAESTTSKLLEAKRRAQKNQRSRGPGS